jgi:hypothetical protein
MGMPYKRTLLGCVAILFLAASAWGDMDPFAGVEADNFSYALSTFSGTFSPTQDGGVIGFYNDTGSIITSLSLQTTIEEGLTSAEISNSFTCNSGAANPFFLNCGFSYVSSTGSLTINFFGVNPADPDELDGFETEVGEQRGIPPVVGVGNEEADVNDLAAAIEDSASVSYQVGHFAFVFVDPTTGTNGWQNNTPLFGNTTPDFGPPTFTLPEPSTLPLLAGEVLALAGLFWRRVRGHWSKR